MVAGCVAWSRPAGCDKLTLSKVKTESGKVKTENENLCKPSLLEFLQRVQPRLAESNWIATCCKTEEFETFALLLLSNSSVTALRLCHLLYKQRRT